MAMLALCFEIDDVERIDAASAIIRGARWQDSTRIPDGEKAIEYVTAHLVRSPTQTIIIVSHSGDVVVPPAENAKPLIDGKFEAR
ncbi:MAG: hypothetical protein QM651_15205 [Rhodoblastus sp.]